ncbi:MAG: PAS domain-containing protein [Saprospiraceae bacterium]|nr:PAS domain-containing protein [Saprospiraceae bacterium]
MQKFKAPNSKGAGQNLISAIDQERFLTLQTAFETSGHLNGRLLLAIEGTGYGLWDWDISNDIAYFSAKFRELVGYDTAEYTGGLAALTKITHPADLQGTIDAITAHFEKKAPYFHEYRLKTESGDYRWFLVMGQAVWDDEGKPIRMAGLLSDISVRKQTEEALKSSERRLKQAQELAHLGSWIFDTKTSEIHWSDELYRIFEIERTTDENLYAIFRSVVHQEDLPVLDAALQSGKPYAIEHRICCKPDKIKYILCTADIILDSNGGILKILGISQDITERKVLENSRLEYQQMLELLLFTLSHKIRKPVANIHAIADVIDSDEFENSLVLKEYLSYLKQSNRELDAYIHELNHLLVEKKRQFMSEKP